MTENKNNNNTKKRTNMQLTKEEQLLATGHIGYLFRKFAIPGIIGLLFIGLQPLVDGAILGNYVGAEALAGVNLFMPVYTFLSASAVIVGIGCQTIVSLSLGSRSYQEAQNALRTAFVFMLLYSLLMAGLCYLGAEPLSRLLGANERLMAYTAPYIRNFAPFFPFLTLIFIGDYLLKATGRPYYALTILGLILLINVGLDLLFIGVFGWGVRGAALATGIALGTSFLAMLPSLVRRHSLVNLRQGRFSFRLLGQMLYNGSSEGLSELSAGITVFLFNWAMMNTWGENGVAAFTAVNYLLYLGVQLFVGLSDGIIPVFSYNYGAGNLERMRRALFLGYRTNALIGLSFFALIFFGGSSLIPLFFDGSQEEQLSTILSIAGIGASCTAFAFFLNGANILSSSFFTSMGDARTSVVISLLRGLVLIATGIFVYPLLLGEHGIWLVIPAAEAITFLYCCFLLKNKVSWVLPKR
ncbi:MATE efflux family protein [gut metagenome]|uniref:Multidrug export protein MepA n=1 Tax=gut metagenome TaxID=749906 RepID=J9G7G6_9ZZZZ